MFFKCLVEYNCNAIWFVVSWEFLTTALILLLVIYLLDVLFLLDSFLFLFFLNVYFIEVYLTYNVSGAQQGDSVIQIHVCYF